MTITLTFRPEERKALTVALREYVDLRIPINEYVDRLYPDAGEDFKRTKIRSVGRKVRRVRALLFTIHNAI
jgi:hypothetical protein